MTNSRRRTLAVAALALVTSGVVALSGGPSYAVGTAYWVDKTNPSCSDSGSGSQSAPFCTITAGAKKAVNPGDTVHVAPGIYREQVTIAGSGTASDPITLVGDAPGVVVLGTSDLSGATWNPTATTAWSTAYAPPSQPRQVFIDGSRATQASSATATTNGSWFYDSVAKVLYVDTGGANPSTGHTIEAGAQSFGVAITSRSGIVVSNIEARRQNFAGVRVLSSSGVTVDQVTAVGSASNGILLDTSTAGVQVTDATVTNSVAAGIKLNGTSGAVVRGSTSHGNGLHGISLANSSGNTIDGNTTYGNVSLNPNAAAAGIDVNSTSSTNTVVRNTSYENQDSGFQVYAGSNNVLVARNVAYRNGDHGFDTLNSTGARYLNNTSYDNNRDGISVEGTSTGATLANNVLVDNGDATNEYDIYVDPGSVNGFTADYDLAYNHATTPVVKVNGVVYKRLADYAAASGQESHGLGLTPAFVDAAGGDLRLQGGSPATDSGDSAVSSFVADDPDGNTSADDSIVPDTGAGSPAYSDRGAYEFQPGVAVTNYAPHAAVFGDPPAVVVPPSASVTADARGSADADTHPIDSYSFDFGDGTVVGPQPGATATHAYQATGTYTISVTVTDTAGQSSTDSDRVVVSARQLQTYHVEQGAASCTDTGDGSQTTPFCSLKPAMQKAVAGDTVLVGAGRYREQLTPTGTGEPGAPMTITAAPGAVILGSDDLSDAAGWTQTATSAWKHAFDPTAAPTQTWLDGVPLAKAASATTTTNGSWFYDASAKLLYVDVGGGNPATGHSVEASARNFGILLRAKSYVDISGFTVKQTGLTGVYLDASDHLTPSGLTVTQAGAYGVTVDGSAQVDLRDVMSHDNLSIGVRFSNSRDSTLAGATTHNNQLHGVSVQGSRNVTVSRVTSYANLKPDTRLAAGIDVSMSSVDTVVRDSTAYGNDDSGFEAYTGSTNTVFLRNVAYDNGDHGIDSSAAPGSVLVSNTIVGNATAGINFEGSSSGATSRDNVTADNAVNSTRTVGEIRVDESSEPGISLDRDLVFQSGGGPLFEWSSQPYSTLASFRAASGQEPNGLSGNPGFVDLAGRNLHLTEESPALDAAYSAVAQWARQDHDGTPPLDDPAVTDSGNGPDPYADLGAFEYDGPVAQGVVSPRSGTQPLTVTVDGSSSTGPVDPITGYEWDCGNGSRITSSTGTCTYAAAGQYTVALTVTDRAGGRDSWSTTVNVDGVPDSPPTARLGASASSGYVPFDVILDASASTDTDQTPIASYAFDCGNGVVVGPKTSPTVTCTYSQAGSYQASVTVRDTAGLTATASVQVTVLGEVAPTAVLTLSRDHIKAGQSVVADGSASTDPDRTPIATYRFDCGNGVTTGELTSATKTCTYPTGGGKTWRQYTLRLWVTDTAGLTTSTTQTVFVR